MSDELRDRISEVMRRAEGEWWREEDPQTDVDSHVAQAVIDDLGLHYVDSEEYAQVGLDWLEVEKGRQIVGKWEKQ